MENKWGRGEEEEVEVVEDGWSRKERQGDV
jgi:hypothetical protein